MRSLRAAGFLLLFPLALFAQESKKDAPLETALLNAYGTNLNAQESGKTFALVDTITEASLESINWYLSPWLMADGNETLTFSKGSFIIRAKHMGTIAYGSYKLGASNTIELHIANWNADTASNVKDLGFGKNVVTVSYKNDVSDFHYRARIDLGASKLDFYAPGTRTPEGASYKLDGYDTEKLFEGSTATAGGRLNVRSIPSVSGVKILTLDNKQAVELRGRSVAKFTVDGIEDRWYYIAIYYPEDGGASYGWVFGGYLKDVKVATSPK